MRISIDPVETDRDLPAHSEVVVIGGGIVGVSTALFLAMRGVPVTLCEKGVIAGEQSSRNWGWCRTMGRDVAEIPLAIESLKLWRGMNVLVEGETGFRERGNLYLLDGDKDIASYEHWLERARPYQLGAKFIEEGDIGSMLPGTVRRWRRALFTPTDGTAEPFKAVPAMAAAARRHGARIIQSCAVRGIETSGGRVSSVVTEKGEIACGAVVLAGGAWSRLFCGNNGIDFPQLKVLNSVMRTTSGSQLPDMAVGGPNFSFRKRVDGGFTVASRNTNIAPLVPDSFRLLFDYLPVLTRQWHEFRLRVGKRFIEEWRIPRRWKLDEKTPFETVRVLDPEPSQSDIAQGWARIVRAFPAATQLSGVEQWAGLIDVTPDAVPVISPIERIPGFFLASGFSGHGFGVGPGAGTLMADLVMGTDPVVDPAPFRLSRFKRAAA